MFGQSVEVKTQVVRLDRHLLSLRGFGKGENHNLCFGFNCGYFLESPLIYHSIYI